MSKKSKRLVVQSCGVGVFTAICGLLAGCGSGAASSSPTPTAQVSVIQPSISHAVAGAGDVSGVNSGPTTRSWIAKLDAFVGSYPNVATTEQRASLARATANPSESGAPTAAPSATPLAATCDPIQQWRCSIGPTNAQRRWLVVNDGVAQQWLPAFQAIVKSAGNLRVDFFTVRNCQSSLNDAGLLVVGSEKFTVEESKACSQMHKDALKESRDARVQLAVLADQAQLVGSNREKDYRLGLRDFVARLRANTAVATLGRPPIWRVSPSTCFDSSLSNLRACFGDVKEGQQAAEAQRNSTVAAAGVFIDPRAWMCARGMCTLFVFGEPVTLDSTSLAPEFARTLAPVLQESLVAAINQG